MEGEPLSGQGNPLPELSHAHDIRHAGGGSQDKEDRSHAHRARVPGRTLADQPGARGSG